MTTKYLGKYRIDSNRLFGWDYSQNAAYFVTICTRDRKCYLAEVVDHLVCLSPIGKIAHNYWGEIPEHFPFVVLDEFVVMPNHIHGILIISKTVTGKDDVETQNLASLRDRNQSTNRFGPQSKNLSSIIRGFKSGVKKYATIHNIDFAWQTSYYDQIIKNELSYLQIKEYIFENPKRWGNDKLNPGKKL